MSHLSVSPAAMTAAAANLETIAATIDQAHRAAVPSVLSIAPAAADEVSVSIAQVFAEHAQDYQGVAREAAAFQAQFGQNLHAGAASYLGAENILVYLLQRLNDGAQWIWQGQTQLIVNLIVGINPYQDYIPGPLQPFVVGIPFLSIFVGGIPYIMFSWLIQGIIGAITG